MDFDNSYVHILWVHLYKIFEVYDQSKHCNRRTGWRHAPLLGWAAISNTIEPNALLLVLIIMVWTPPHFWALAVYRVDDYADAEVPMLPVQKGVPFTKQHILLYTFLLLACTMLPYAVQMFGEIYLFSALVLGLIFLYYSFKLYKDDTNAAAMPTFAYSIIYLAALFAAMLVDHYIYL